MSIAACLLIYSLAVLALGPPLLRSLTHTGFAPRLGIAAWLTAIGSVLLAWLAAGVLTIAQLLHLWDRGGIAVASCMARLRGAVAGHAGIGPQLILTALVVLMSVGAVVAGARLVGSVSRMRARAHHHADAVRLVGHRVGLQDFVLVEAAKPAAYCVAGRPPAIVVTSAALSRLDDQQLAAVLAHERAHLAGHHWIVVAALRSVAALLPRLTLMTQGAQKVSLLLEMCADDAAARQHDPRTLLSGLVTLCRAAPAEALAAADIAVLARAERLALAPEYRRRLRAALIAAVAGLAAGPVMVTALAASGVFMCGL